MVTNITNTCSNLPFTEKHFPVLVNFDIYCPLLRDSSFKSTPSLYMVAFLTEFFREKMFVDKIHLHIFKCDIQELMENTDTHTFISYLS